MKKTIGMFALMAILVATVFVACKKSSDEEVSTLRKSKFYDKFSNKNLHARGVSEGFNIEDWSDQDLLDLAKDLAYEHNQSLTDFEANVNFETSSSQEKRNFIVNHYSNFLGITYENSDFLSHTENQHYESKTSTEMEEIIRSSYTNNISLGYCNEVINLISHQEVGSNIRNSMNNLENNILGANDLTKKDKFNLFMNLEVGYASFNLWKNATTNSANQYSRFPWGNFWYIISVDVGAYKHTYNNLFYNVHLSQQLAEERAWVEFAWASNLAVSHGGVR